MQVACHSISNALNKIKVNVIGLGFTMYGLALDNKSL